MLISSIAFVAGVCLLQRSAGLPPACSYVVIPAALFLLRYPAARYPAVLLLGYFWAALQAELALSQTLDRDLEGQTVLVQGTVLDIPRQLSDTGIRFPFHVDTLIAANRRLDFAGKVRLNWYETDIRPAAGERWELAVRLKRPHGFANPGGFDYEQWLFQQRIRATGYVRNDSRNKRISRGGVSAISGFRHRLMSVYAGLDQDLPGLALVRALTIGDRSAITSVQWDSLRATGTSHLMAISGLHVSLVAGLVFWLGRFGWSRSSGLTRRVPAQKAAALLALGAAVLYAVLAGFAIPTRRAVLMVGVVMLAIVADRYTSLRHMICLAAVVTLLVDPMSVLSAGWWLSFCAVSVIAWLAGGRHGVQGFARKWVLMHIVLAFSMFPLLLLFFQQTSVIAPFANIVAVPWVGMVVVPVALAGTLVFAVSELAGEWLIIISAALLGLVWPWLDWLAGLDFALWSQHAPPAWTLLPAVAGLAILLAPRGLPARWPGLMLLLPLLVVQPDRPVWGEARLTLLDVGQGLAAVIRTENHTLVFDAGPRFSSTFDTGQAVLVPFLRHQGVTRLDMLVVSHGDNDHIGGVDSLLAAFPAGRIISSVPEELSGNPVTPCRQGDVWQWDGVDFSVLYPGVEDTRTGNNASCVLRVEVPGGRTVLLTGDIERAAELSLLRNQHDALKTDILVVPHHGSKTSSSLPFVQAARPAVALFPVGHLNRYRLPNPEVVDRYAALGAEMYETGETGAITLSLVPGMPQPELHLYREESPRYWRPAD